MAFATIGQPMIGVDNAPLGRLIERIDGAVAHLSCRRGPVGEPGWLSLDSLDAAAFESWYAAVLRRLGDRQAAALAVGSEVAQTAVVAFAVPFFAAGCLPVASIDEVQLSRTDDGHLSGVAWCGTGLALDGADDPTRLMTESLLELERPFEELRKVARVGRPGLWGAVADMVASYALGAAQALGTDRSHAWNLCTDIVDRLAARQPELRSRPKPFPVTYSGGEELFGVRGTCCLWYRSCDAAPPGNYCSTCPLRTDESRTEVLRAYLEAENTAG